jgi:RNA polymerase sigma-70 factor, ECF subfamily
VKTVTTALISAYRRYFPLLVQKCARMLGDRAEAQDVAQESFVRLHRAGLCDAEARLVTAWLYRTSTRLAIDRLRARRRHAADAAAVDSLTSDPSMETDALARQLWIELAHSLPKQQLEVALLTRFDGLTQSEVAEVTGIHPRRIRRLLARFDAAVKRLREKDEAWTR